MVNPQIKTWKNFLHLNSLIFVLESWTIRFEMVLNCAGGKRDVTTMFTYSHANTPLGQSERAYYLSYFINRGYYTGARRYEFYFRVAKQYFTNERSEWAKYCFCHEKIKFISSSRRVMFFLLYRHADDGVFDDFPKISDHLPKISEDLPKLFRRPDERSRTFPKISENFRRCPKIAEDCRRLSRKTRRCFDDTPTNLSTI